MNSWVKEVRIKKINKWVFKHPWLLVAFHMQTVSLTLSLQCSSYLQSRLERRDLLMTYLLLKDNTTESSTCSPFSLSSKHFEFDRGVKSSTLRLIMCLSWDEFWLGTLCLRHCPLLTLHWRDMPWSLMRNHIPQGVLYAAGSWNYND